MLQRKLALLLASKHPLVLPELITRVNYLTLDGTTITDGNKIPVIDGENRAGFYNPYTQTIEYATGGTDYVAHFVDANGDDYKVVKYISATNQQTNSSNTPDAAFIKAGGTFDATTRSLTRMRFTTLVTNTTEGLSGKNVSGRFTWGFANVSPTSKFYVGLGSENVSTSVNRDTNWHTFSLDWNDKSWTIDSTKGYFTNTVTTYGTGEIYLFGRLTSTTTDGRANKPMDGDCNFHKMFSQGKMVQNLISCVKGTKAGMYDAISKTWLISGGSKDFTYTE